MKRTALPRRSTPLRQVSPLRAAQPARGRPRRKGMQSCPAKVRRLLLSRSGGVCELPRCGADVTTGGHVHHRQRRSQGGDWATGNLLLLCGLSHAQVHADIAGSLGRGWLVKSTDDPRMVRCWVAGAGPVFLLDAGGYEFNPVTAARLADGAVS